MKRKGDPSSRRVLTPDMPHLQTPTPIFTARKRAIVFFGKETERRAKELRDANAAYFNRTRKQRLLKTVLVIETQI